MATSLLRKYNKYREMEIKYYSNTNLEEIYIEVS